jgi:hypothetical protein
MRVPCRRSGEDQRRATSSLPVTHSGRQGTKHHTKEPNEHPERATGHHGHKHAKAIKHCTDGQLTPQHTNGQIKPRRTHKPPAKAAQHPHAMLGTKHGMHALLSSSGYIQDNDSESSQRGSLSVSNGGAHHPQHSLQACHPPLWPSRCAWSRTREQTCQNGMQTAPQDADVFMEQMQRLLLGRARD